MKHFILTIIALLSLNLNSNATILVDGICYDLNSIFDTNGNYIGEEAIVVQNTFDDGHYSGDITIPATIHYYDTSEKKTYTYNVTEINDRAFAGNEEITGLTILAPIKRIDLGYCKGLKTLVLPNTIEDFNCEYCSSLTSIQIPTSMKILDFSNLKGCNSITSIEIPNNITATRETLWGMENLKTVIIDDGNTILETNGNFCEDWKSLEYLYLGRDIINQVKSSTLKTVEIGPNVKELLQCMFQNCSALESVIIHGETTIGNKAFAGCATLSKIEGLENVTNIGNEAFARCSSLTSISLSQNIKELRDNIFAGCIKLASVSLPNSITWLGDNVFSGCTGLTSVSFSQEIISLGNYAFSDCTALTTISLPNTITWLGDGVFDGCTGLTSVKLSDNLKVIPPYGFNGCTNLLAIEIPEGVERIENQAFGKGIDRNGNKLTSIKFPSTLKYIGPSAFADCYKLEEVTLPNKLTSIGISAFSSCSALKSVTRFSPISRSMSKETEEALSIGDNAFAYCSNLADINLGNIDQVGSYAFSNTKWFNNQPDGLLTIGNTIYSYKGEEKLKNTDVKIADNIKYICDYALSNKDITNVSLPSSLLYIGNGAFNDNSIKKVTIPTSVKEIGEKAFEKNPLTELIIEDGESHLTIPQSNNGLFGANLQKLYIGRNLNTTYCTSFMHLPLKEITFGKTVKQIPCIFYDNKTLKQITCLSTEAPLLNNDYRYNDQTYNAFDADILSSCTLSVPEESINIYKNAEVWKDFKNISGNTTGIQDAIIDHATECPLEYFDLEGRKVQHPQKGHLYITNKGKKVVL